MGEVSDLFLLFYYGNILVQNELKWLDILKLYV